MYLIGIKNDRRLCGNNGMQHTAFKSERRIQKQAEDFRDMYDLDTVSVLRTFPQALCEMENQEFVSYVRSHGLCMVNKKGSLS